MRWGSKPVSAARNATRRTFFGASAPAAGAASATSAATQRAAVRKRFKDGGKRGKSRNYNGLRPLADDLAGALFHAFPVPARDVDIHELIRVLQDGVAAPSQRPGLEDVVVLAVDMDLERRVGGDQALHVLVDGGALRPRRQRGSLLVERVVLGQLKAAVVGHAAVGPVEELVVILAVGVVGAPGEVPRHELAELGFLAQVGPLGHVG